MCYKAGTAVVILHSLLLACLRDRHPVRCLLFLFLSLSPFRSSWLMDPRSLLVSSSPQAAGLPLLLPSFVLLAVEAKMVGVVVVLFVAGSVVVSVGGFVAV